MSQSKKYQKMALKIMQSLSDYGDIIVFWKADDTLLIKECFVKMLQQKQRRKRLSAAKLWRDDRRIHCSYAFVSNELRLLDTYAYNNFYKMSSDTFKLLLQLVEKDLQKLDTNARNAISSAEQLSVTLRFFATGESYKSLEYQTRLSHSYLVYCIPNVCRTIWINLKNSYLKFPTTIQQWKSIAKDFEQKWQFPLCLGALDDVGANGRTNDSAVLKNSSLQRILDTAEAHFPPDEIIGNNRLLPYVVVGDGAFALHRHLIKPFSHRINIVKRQNFNKRLSRARQVVERSFGILSSRFRVFQKSINMKNVKNIETITLACCVLHNFLMDNSLQYANFECPSNPQTCEESSNIYAPFEGVRTEFMEFFNNEGKLQWMEM
ncbi:protein ALP1-like [Teleopsis dalmanni]|uniref:protein ALP1-like n=1 Tax=Teleopsis dalmanni TaxID=139649 RepID=UPI0018CF01EF|nr:protein ALP1-like [Teleopsis dalmanni]